MKILNFFQKIIDVLRDYFIERILEKKSIIHHNGEKLFFHTSNSLMNYRVKTFSTKEPETLEWIDTFNSKSIFWDNGANVGLYSIYASKKRNTQTIAFEPSYFNLEFLSKNIIINNISDKVIIMPLPLNDVNKLSKLQFISSKWSGAHNTFDKGIDQYGNKYMPKFEYKVYGLNGKFLVEHFNFDQPDYIKIDVDGIEFSVIVGLGDILKKVKEILIETNYKNKIQSKKIRDFMIAKNFKIHRICNQGFENTPFRNEIWINLNFNNK